jgi:hypothetical protein
MGASNGSSPSGGKSFYTLKEKKVEGAANTGQIRFYKSIKTDSKWELGEGFSQMSGILRQIEVKQFEWQGKPKFELVFHMDDDKSSEKMEVKTSFPTTVSKNMLNALSNVQKYGVVSFEVGQPSEYQGKMYPSIFVKNDGQICKFSYTKANGNQPPKVETVRDEEGNEIKKGVVAERTFWIDVVSQINAKLQAQSSIPKPQPINNPETADSPKSSGSAEDDLPF